MILRNWFQSEVMFYNSALFNFTTQYITESDCALCSSRGKWSPIWPVWAEAGLATKRSSPHLSWAQTPGSDLSLLTIRGQTCSGTFQSDQIIWQCECLQINLALPELPTRSHILYEMCLILWFQTDFKGMTCWPTPAGERDITWGGASGPLAWLSPNILKCLMQHFLQTL